MNITLDIALNMPTGIAAIGAIVVLKMKVNPHNVARPGIHFLLTEYNPAHNCGVLNPKIYVA